jgi:hypothetical protein
MCCCKNKSNTKFKMYRHTQFTVYRLYFRLCTALIARALALILNRIVYYDSLLTVHTYHSRFIPEGVAEVSQIFLRNTHVLPTLVNYEEHCRPWQVVNSSPSYFSLSDASAINPLVASYDIHGGKREVLFFYFVPDTTRDRVDRQKTNAQACKHLI